jgi:hypothetical protein
MENLSMIEAKNEEEFSMKESEVPEVITRKSRSEGAKRMWERRRAEQKDEDMSDKRIVWHIILSAMGIVITLGSLIFGCYFSLRSDLSDLSKEIVKIETVLIIKGVAPAELFAREE